jgi:hypothetical protein
MKHIIAKILIFIINLVLWASGIILIVFGSLALASPTTIVNLLDMISGVSNVTNLIDVTWLLEGMAIFMIVLGSLLFLFGGVGCGGAFRMHKRMIMNYWLMLILGVLTEIGAIVYGAVYPPTMNTWVQQQLNSSLRSEFVPVTISGTKIIYSNNISASSWEMLQVQTQCCGASGISDYAAFTWAKPSAYPNATIPPSCCVSNQTAGTLFYSTSDFVDLSSCLSAPPASGSYYKPGCYNVVIDMLWQFDNIAIIIAACLMAAQLLGIMLTVHVWHRMVREDGHM